MNFGAQVTDEIFSRRELLLRGGAGFGALALSGMLARDKAFADAGSLAPGQAHFAPKAKNVIFLFMEGGPSHIDLFDPARRSRRCSRVRARGSATAKAAPG